MKVRIGKLEIILENMDELDELIEKYGSVIADSGGETPNTSIRRSTGGGGIDDRRDRVVLETLINAGSSGILATELGKMLGKRGRGTRGAAKRWAVKVGLVTDGGVEPFEEIRIGSQRGIRLDSTHLAMAKGLL